MSQIREGYEVSSKMLDIWSVQMNLAKKLIEVCNRHNLRLWAVGGTLLGAVRHKGYIPWDDDIDMGMPRKDYDTLVAISKEEFKNPYFFQTGLTDIGYPRFHGQLRMNGTAAILPGDVYAKFNQSIFIDIFIYDDVPDNDEDMRQLICKSDHIKKLLVGHVRDRFLLTKNLFYYFHLLKLVAYFTFHSYERIFKQYEDLFRSVDARCAKRFGWIAYWYKENFIWDKYWFRETVWLPFEDFKMPAPIDYDKVLSRQYGLTYMKPSKVPADHSGYVVMDASKSYKEYLPSLRKLKKLDCIVNFFKKFGLTLKRP